MQTETTERVLAAVLFYLDPDGTLGLAQKLPASFDPFLPSARGVGEKPTMP